MFYLVSGQSYLCTKPLKYYEDLFPSDFFFRIHRSTLLNMNYVLSYDNKKGKVMTNTEKVFEVAARRKSEFNALIKLKFKS